MGDDLERAGFSRLHHEIGRPDLDSFDPRRRRVAGPCTFGDPPGDDLVRRGLPREDPATAMRHRAGRLQEQKTLLRSRHADATSTSLLHDVIVVFGRFEAEERQPESVLTAALAVAAAGVAAVLREDRHDLRVEIDRPRLAGVGLIAARRHGRPHPAREHHDDQPARTAERPRGKHAHGALLKGNASRREVFEPYCYSSWSGLHLPSDGTNNSRSEPGFSGG
jgi:hypothetical protein